MLILAELLWVGVAVGLLALLLQAVVAARHFRRCAATSVKGAKGGELPAISVLKPLCGVDDDLENNLASFAALDYPSYEVLLGVKERTDPAFAVAERAAQRWPRTFRVVVQRGVPGFNPKVNQLVTLSEEAHHGILIVSDSNTRAEPGFLRAFARAFDDPEVVCVTQPIGGQGARTLGSALDNLHLASSIGPGMVAAKRVGGQDIVVGKSMALRKEALDALGGFFAVRNHLAEDYVLGLATSDRLGKKVALADGRVLNISQHKSVRDFLRRYGRWSIIHRTATSWTTYFAQALLNPWPLALVALALAPNRLALAGCAVALAVKALVDVSVAGAVNGARVPWHYALLVPLKDLLLFWCWVRGLFVSTVQWREHRLKVCADSLLVPLDSLLEEDDEQSLAPRAS